MSDVSPSSSSGAQVFPRMPPRSEGRRNVQPSGVQSDPLPTDADVDQALELAASGKTDALQAIRSQTELLRPTRDIPRLIEAVQKGSVIALQMLTRISENRPEVFRSEDVTGLLLIMTNPPFKHSDISAAGIIEHLADEKQTILTRDHKDHLVILASFKPELVSAPLEVLAVERSWLWSPDDVIALAPYAGHAGIERVIDSAIYSLCGGEWTTNESEMEPPPPRSSDGISIELMDKVKFLPPPSSGGMIIESQAKLVESKEEEEVSEPMQCKVAERIQMAIKTQLPERPELLTALNVLSSYYGPSRDQVDLDRVISRAETGDEEALGLLGHVLTTLPTPSIKSEHVERVMDLIDWWPKSYPVFAALLINHPQLLRNGTGESLGEDLFRRAREDDRAASLLKDLVTMRVWKPTVPQFRQLVNDAPSHAGSARLVHATGFQHRDFLRGNDLTRFLLAEGSSDCLDIVELYVYDRPHSFSEASIEALLNRIEGNQKEAFTPRLIAILTELAAERPHLFFNNPRFLRRIHRALPLHKEMIIALTYLAASLPKSEVELRDELEATIGSEIATRREVADYFFREVSQNPKRVGRLLPLLEKIDPAFRQMVHLHVERYEQTRGLAPHVERHRIGQLIALAGRGSGLAVERLKLMFKPMNWTGQNEMVDPYLRVPHHVHYLFTDKRSDLLDRLLDAATLNPQVIEVVGQVIGVTKVLETDEGIPGRAIDGLVERVLHPGEGKTVQGAATALAAMVMEYPDVIDASRLDRLIELSSQTAEVVPALKALTLSHPTFAPKIERALAAAKTQALEQEEIVRFQIEKFEQGDRAAEKELIRLAVVSPEAFPQDQIARLAGMIPTRPHVFNVLTRLGRARAVVFSPEHAELILRNWMEIPKEKLATEGIDRHEVESVLVGRMLNLLAAQVEEAGDRGALATLYDVASARAEVFQSSDVTRLAKVSLARPRLLVILRSLWESRPDLFEENEIKTMGMALLRLPKGTMFIKQWGRRVDVALDLASKIRDALLVGIEQRDDPEAGRILEEMASHLPEIFDQEFVALLVQKTLRRPRLLGVVRILMDGGSLPFALEDAATIVYALMSLRDSGLTIGDKDRGKHVVSNLVAHVMNALTDGVKRGEEGAVAALGDVARTSPEVFDVRRVTGFTRMISQRPHVLEVLQALMKRRPTLFSQDHMQLIVSEVKRIPEVDVDEGEIAQDSRVVRVIMIRMRALLMDRVGRKGGEGAVEVLTEIAGLFPGAFRERDMVRLAKMSLEEREVLGLLRILIKVRPKLFSGADAGTILRHLLRLPKSSQDIGGQWRQANIALDLIAPLRDEMIERTDAGVDVEAHQLLVDMSEQVPEVYEAKHIAKFSSQIPKRGGVLRILWRLMQREPELFPREALETTLRHARELPGEGRDVIAPMRDRLLAEVRTAGDERPAKALLALTELAPDVFEARHVSRLTEILFRRPAIAASVAQLMRERYDLFSDTQVEAIITQVGRIHFFWEGRMFGIDGMRDLLARVIDYQLEAYGTGSHDTMHAILMFTQAYPQAFESEHVTLLGEMIPDKPYVLKAIWRLTETCPKRFTYHNIDLIASQLDDLPDEPLVTEEGSVEVDLVKDLQRRLRTMKQTQDLIVQRDEETEK